MRENLPSVTLAMVMSLDGRTSIPHGRFPTSPEDQDHFSRLKREFPYVLIGRETWWAARSHMTEAPPRRLVFSHTPDHFTADALPGIVEFTDKDPLEALRMLRGRGISRVLLAGGSTLNAAFLRQRLITECIITIEPIILGQGKPLFNGDVPDTHLRFRSQRQLNSRGTTVLEYTMEYEHPTDQNR